MNAAQEIEKLTREEVVAILEDRCGYQCYDNESTMFLRDTLLSDIAHGVLPVSVLDYRRVK